MRKSHLAVGALVLFLVGTARASDPVGVYALVDKVILEPNGEAAQRVQVWGGFSVATGRGEAYAAPVRGYLYFTVAQGKEDLCRREWNDLKKVAGTDQVVALGSRYEQQKLTVRRPKARPRPTARADERKVAQLVADLNSDQFTIRERASKELAKLGDSAEPALRKALAANPSAEVRRRLEALVESETPDIYPLGFGLTKVRRDTDYAPIRNLLRLPAPASPADGDLVDLGKVTLSVRNINDAEHRDAKYRFEIEAAS